MSTFYQKGENMKELYPLSKTLRIQCEYSPYQHFPIYNDCQMVYMNLIGDTQDNKKSNISYLFFKKEEELYVRFGVFHHTPNEVNERFSEHLLLGDVKLSKVDVQQMLVDLQRVLANLGEEK